MSSSAPARILVVDDDPALRDLLAEYLDANGFAVEAVGDGAAMRRALGHGMPDAFVLDLEAHRLLRAGVEVRLTSAEFDLLRIFTERPNRVLSRDDLVDRLKGFARDPFDRSIDIRVTRLRRKIETDPAAPA